MRMTPFFVSEADAIGEGFHSSGNNLSGIKRDEYAGRLTGLQAAERRLAAQRKIGKGGVLGGRGTAGRSVREVLAEVSCLLGRTLDQAHGLGCGTENTGR